MNRADFIAEVRRLAESLAGRVFDLVLHQVETTRAAAALSAREQLIAAMTGAARDIEFDVPTCRVCGCTDDDCSGCVERTGEPCHWIAPDLCSACEPGAPAKSGRPAAGRCMVCGEPAADAREHQGDETREHAQDAAAETAPADPDPAEVPQAEEPAPAAPEPEPEASPDPDDSSSEDDDTAAEPDDDVDDTSDDDERPVPVTAARSALVRVSRRDRFATLEATARARRAREASR